MGVFFYKLSESGKKVCRVMRAWRGFRVILHGENWQLLVSHAFDGPVVGIQMSYFETCPFQRRGVDGEGVVLRSDFDSSTTLFYNGMIGSMVPEFQLEC